MAKLIMLVLADRDLCEDVVDIWKAAGVPGITILESTGLGRRQVGIRDDMPLMPSLSDLLASQESHHRTLFSVIEDEATLERVIVATKQIIGDFSRHNTGLLFVIPVTQVFGFEKKM